MHRELLYYLVWRDIKVRYKQTVLGASWIILQPLLMTLVFAIFLGKIAQVPSQGVPHVLFLFSGVLPWTFFSNAVSGSSFSLVINAPLITRVYFPRSMVPLAATLVRLSDFFVAAAVLVMLMFYYRQPFNWTILIAPVLIAQMTILAMGLGMWFSALNAKYRDISTALPVLLQLWMFTSPIVYPESMVPERWKWIYELNPMVGIIEGFRSSLLGLDFNWRALLISVLVTSVLVVYSTYAFKRLDEEFADVV
ncbi:MAG TPA: ABC transporter permease [Pyrinomonadaceae bacterium]|nr:ABC transporter permease [Pyrinomonadaceae bacterium]